MKPDELFTPEELDLVRQSFIRRRVHVPQLKATRRVETTRRSIDVLRFHLQHAAPSRASPLLCRTEQRARHPTTAELRGNPQVPEQSEVIATFQEVKFGISRDCDLDMHQTLDSG